MAAPTVEKSILLHVARWHKGSSRNRLSPSVLNSWLLIKSFADGPRIFDIFRNLPQEQPDSGRRGSGCALIGSSLYVVGGAVEYISGWNHSNRILRLDTLNPADGWKTIDSLPFYPSFARTAVAGNFIYLFADHGCFRLVDPTKYSHLAPLWGYVYDTIGQKGYPIKPPTDCLQSNVRFCAAVDGGVVVSLVNQFHWKRFYLHHPVQNSFYSNNIPLPEIYEPCAVSNEILYSLKITDADWILYAYDICSGNLLYQVEIPKFDDPYIKGLGKMHMIPLSNSEICLLWHRDCGKFEKSVIYYTKFSISCDPFPSATILEEDIFDDIDAFDVVNCLSIDSYQVQDQDVCLEGISLETECLKSHCLLEENFWLELKNQLLEVCKSSFQPTHTGRN